MFNIFIGILLVFFKTNLSFIEIGVVFYLTNILGYLSIFFGLRELAPSMPNILKIQPYVVVMIIHSSLFFILNSLGYSPLNIALSTITGVIIGYIGLAVVIAGMFPIYYVIHELIQVCREDLNGFFKLKILDRISNALLILFIFAGLSFMINIFPLISELFMAALLMVKSLFLICYYYILIRKNRKLA